MYLGGIVAAILMLLAVLIGSRLKHINRKLKYVPELPEQTPANDDLKTIDITADEICEDPQTHHRVDYSV